MLGIEIAVRKREGKKKRACAVTTDCWKNILQQENDIRTSTETQIPNYILWS